MRLFGSLRLFLCRPALCRMDGHGNESPQPAFPSNKDVKAPFHAFFDDDLNPGHPFTLSVFTSHPPYAYRALRREH